MKLLWKSVGKVMGKSRMSGTCVTQWFFQHYDYHKQTARQQQWSSAARLKYLHCKRLTTVKSHQSSFTSSYLYHLN